MRVLYLHGFASGPRSTKGLAFEKHFAARGVEVLRLDLRVPSLEHLRLSAMLDVVRAALDAGGPAVLVGSSLGGLTAARVAEIDARVQGLVLLAPAFRIAERWQELGADWDTWKATGWLAITDYTTGNPARVDFAFIEDAARIDQGYPALALPTLILHGTRDAVVPISYSRTVARGRPHIELVELDDTHELVASLPTLLARTEAFLENLAR